MNFIDNVRIKRTPNIIDSFSERKINNQVVTYALNCGYEFNSDTLDRFISYSSYREKFRDEKEVFEKLKQQIISGKITLREFETLYDSIRSSGKKESVTLIKNDEILSKFVIENLEIYMQGQDINLGDIIQIVDGREELVDTVLENNFELLSNDYRFREFAEFIVRIKTPEELENMQIRNSYIDEAFIKSGNQKNVMQLFEMFDKKDFVKYNYLIKEAVGSNIGQFIPYLDRMDEIYKVQTGINFITKEIEDITLNHLKRNNILYDENMPNFVLQDNEYIVKCLTMDPTNISKMPDSLQFVFDKYTEEARKIADKIKDEKIKFEGRIPSTYLLQRDIFEGIVYVNPELLTLEENRNSLCYLTEGMQDDEVVDYYKSLGVPFNRDTVVASNFLSVLECLKNDYMTLSDTKREYTEEEYKKIYEELNGKVRLEEVLQSRFLTQNPYFVAELLKSGLDLTNVDFKETRHYEKFYLQLKSIAIKNGVTLPEPKKYEDIIKFTKEDNAYICLDSTESVKKGLEYIKKYGLNQDLLVMLNQQKFDELVICDNIEFFEELAKNNININFKYNTGNRKISLQEVLLDEHFLQTAVEDIKSKGFSPLEQLVAVYDIAKVFKEYRKEEESSGYLSESRSLYEYLNNEYMVCAGYADLIANLGHRLGAKYSKISLDIQSSITGKKVDRTC